MKTERRQRVIVVKAQVAVTIGIGERNDALAAEGAVGIEQIGETLIGNHRLNRIHHGFLARTHRQDEEKPSKKYPFFH